MERPEDTDPGLKLKVFNLFVEASRSTLKSVESQFNRIGLSTGKFLVLIILETYGEMTASKVAERTGTRPNNITALIDKMEKDGLVQMEKRERDRRFVHLKLTPEGRRVLESAMPVAQETVEKTLSSMNTSDLYSLERLLKILVQNSNF